MQLTTTPLFFIGIIFIIMTVSANQVHQDSVRIDFLEGELATKILHYEWLSEITDSLMDEDFKKDWKEFQNSRSNLPTT